MTREVQVIERRSVSRLRRSIVLLEKGAALLGGILVLVLMLLTTADVALRYLFNAPIQGAYELSEMLLVASVFLGVAYVQHLKDHVSVKIVSDRLNEKAQAAIRIFGLMIGLFTVCLIGWQAFKYAVMALVLGEVETGVVEIPLWPAKFALVFGVGLLGVQIIFDLISEGRRLAEHSDTDNAA